MCLYFVKVNSEVEEFNEFSKVTQMSQYFKERILDEISGFLISLLYLRMIDRESV